jgi:hypothetical protein
MSKKEKRIYRKKIKIIEVANEKMKIEYSIKLHKMKKKKKGFQPKLNVYKDKEGNIISEESQILKRWVEYYKDLLNKGESKLEEEYICCPRC